MAVLHSKTILNPPFPRLVKKREPTPSACVVLTSGVSHFQNCDRKRQLVQYDHQTHIDA